MAESYDEVQRKRFDQMKRVTSSPGAGSLRAGKVVQAGAKPATETASYWDIEILGNTYERIDLNTNDRYATGAPVYPVLVNVAAPASAAYAEGAAVTVNIPAGVAPADTGTVDTAAGYARTSGHGCSVVSSGGGSSACYVSTIGWGTVWTPGA